jgi:STE24 endopeptidase
VNDFTILFILLLFLQGLVSFWLSRRQERHVAARREQVPQDFADRVSLDEHRKAADYTIARSRFGRIEQAAGLLLLLIWTLGGALELVDRFWNQYDWPEIATGALVIGTVLLLSALIDIPWAVRSLFTVAVSWAVPKFIAPLFNRFEPLGEGEVADRLQALLERTGFRSGGIFVMDGSRRSSHGNAYFTGFGRTRRIVFFDTLLKQLSPAQVEAVLAHELGHFRRRHILKGLLLSLCMSLAGFAILAWLMQQSWFFTGLGVSEPSSHMALLLFVLVSPLFTFFIGPLLAWYSRRHEFEADAFAAAHSDAESLVSALVNLYRENASSLTPDPLYSKFHDSHPPAAIRIAHLRRAASAG